MAFSHEILQHADKLQKSGLSHAAIAERLGTTRGSLKVSLHNWRKGKYKDKNTKLKHEQDTIEHLVKQKKSTREIAQHLGKRTDSMGVRLNKMGFDSETRKLYGEEVRVRLDELAEQRLAAYTKQKH